MNEVDAWISATGRTLSAGLASDASLAPAQARRKSKFRYPQSRVFSILGTKAKNATSCSNAFEANIVLASAEVAALSLQSTVLANYSALPLSIKFTFKSDNA
ncbi:hypothetical protein [Psychrobacillus lasiicapitis]|uniref:Uncharacterized protein n=1 Tax=Psychrobacillus lasiicapitis TaxID=1636719 RepID=A0A544SSX5_9BACI|nr:hypothetical protein [Psychrobacillus lasiicapitis]TQR08258.1 hypothetical protein FG382_21450 [Psychrobacillus lasiicapitis]